VDEAADVGTEPLNVVVICESVVVTCDMEVVVTRCVTCVVVIAGGSDDEVPSSNV